MKKSTVWTEAVAEKRPAGALAVLGDPIDHSLSPPMHNAALAVMREMAPELETWRYERIRVAADELAEALPRLHAAGFTGLNLTIPHKVTAVSLVESLDAEAREMGAVNTLVRTPTGWHGANTDGVGLATAVRDRLGRTLGEQPVILLGAGGAARSIAVQCLRDGVPELWIGNRSEGRLAELVEQLRGVAGSNGRVRPFLFNAIPTALPSRVLLINATSVGLHEGDALPLDLSRFDGDSALYDTTYGGRNAWAEAAEAQGLAYADGLAMLVRQGVASLARWTGQVPPVALMEAAVEAAKGARC